jgi:hypothetical protein
MIKIGIGEHVHVNSPWLRWLCRCGEIRVVADANHGLNNPMSPTLRDDQSTAARPASTGTTAPVM